MGEAIKKQKINTNHLIELIKNELQHLPNQTGQLNLAILANAFHVSRPAILYKLDQLCKSGVIKAIPVSEKRKHYQLSNDKVRSDFKIDDFATKLEDLLMPIKKTNKIVSFEDVKKETKAPVQTQEQVEPFDLSLDSMEVMTNGDFEYTQVYKPEQTEETFDDFIQRIQAAPTTEVMMKKSDHEILAVMIESINQQSIYLKDLADQLSYAKDKSMIQFLIDDRNRLLKENDQLKDEIKNAYAQKPTVKKLDEQKLRLYQQNLMHMLTMYTASAPHELAIKRNEFREQMSITIQDLIKYTLS